MDSQISNIIKMYRFSTIHIFQTIAPVVFGRKPVENAAPRNWRSFLHAGIYVNVLLDFTVKSLISSTIFHAYFWLWRLTVHGKYFNRKAWIAIKKFSAESVHEVCESLTLTMSWRFSKVMIWLVKGRDRHRHRER